ncbi:MAG: type III pantothenate kinase [Planctomycetes bacterium]|nr:type III pantothenate kinase [Planctomycetota bacterium]MBI3833593.1 type III pantothenate kinase [Planctomycetota bacterium]
MIQSIEPFDLSAPIVVIDIGNSSTKVATWHEDRLNQPLTALTGDDEAFERVFRAHVDEASSGRPTATVISSVVPKALERIREQVESRLQKSALVIGDAIPLPMEFEVDDEHSVGVDRVCAAYAAYEKLQRGCTVISFGTAVTVDLVDDEGTFLGGSILPGIRMQFRALHEYTAVLPEAPPEFPDLPYGRNTIQALQNGVCRGVAGAVRGLVEAYATRLNHWPQVVATGGDAAFLAPHCDFIDNMVADLVLRGAALSYVKHLTDSGV